MNFGENKNEDIKPVNNFEEIKQAPSLGPNDYNFSRINSKDPSINNVNPGANLFANNAPSQGNSSQHALERSGHFGANTLLKASEVNSSKQSGIGSQGIFNPLGM